jgi:hypothetical protein
MSMRVTETFSYVLNQPILSTHLSVSSIACGTAVGRIVKGIKRVVQAHSGCTLIGEFEQHDAWSKCWGVVAAVI